MIISIIAYFVCKDQKW